MNYEYRSQDPTFDLLYYSLPFLMLPDQILEKLQKPVGQQYQTSRTELLY